MITARLLNSEAQLNNYKIVGGITFVNPDTIRVIIQLYNDEFGIRHIPSSAAGVNLTVNCSDGTSEIVPMANTGFEDDRSLWFADIVTDNVNLMSKTLVGGNITFVLENDTTIPGSTARGVIFNALQRLIIS